MKQYEKMQLVSSPYYEAETFHNEMKGAIGSFQEQGLEVEIQFKPTESRLSALILAYKEPTK